MLSLFIYSVDADLIGRLVVALFTILVCLFISFSSTKFLIYYISSDTASILLIILLSKQSISYRKQYAVMHLMLWMILSTLITMQLLTLTTSNLSILGNLNIYIGFYVYYWVLLSFHCDQPLLDYLMPMLRPLLKVLCFLQLP